MAADAVGVGARGGPEEEERDEQCGGERGGDAVDGGVMGWMGGRWPVGVADEFGRADAVGMEDVEVGGPAPDGCGRLEKRTEEEREDEIEGGERTNLARLAG